MLCAATTSRDTPCQREGHIVAGSIALCWQHAADLERHYAYELGVYHHQAQVEELQQTIDQLRESMLFAAFDRAGEFEDTLRSGVSFIGPCVYIAESPIVPGLVKIGHTARLQERMSALTARALVAIPGTIADEAAMHRRFGHLRWCREWFVRKGELADFIDQAA
jgi:hypothetical protein